MKLSIVIPCFNVGKFLEDALNSVCRQTYKNLEIICIDDGSTDETSGILAIFAAKDSRIQIISKKNTGYGDSVNLGLERATGDYVAIFEPDDFIDSDMYSVLMCNAKLMNLDISRCTYSDYKEGLDIPNECKKLPKNRLYCPRKSSDASAFRHQPSIWSAVYRRDWLNENRIRLLPTPGASFQDTSFAFKTNLLAERCFAVDKPFYHYRSHPNNSVKSAKNIFAPLNEYQECIEFAREYGYIEVAKSVVLEMEYSVYKWNYQRIGASDRRKFLSRWRQEWKGLLNEGFRFQKSKHRFHAWLLIYFPFLFRLNLDRKISGS